MGDEVPDFERAAFTTAGAHASVVGAVCQACAGPLPGEYFQVDGRVLCPGCRAKVAAAGDASGLSPRERVVMALVYGGAAALLGTIVWYVVARVTGMELGIIAIGVGLFVGMAVKKGSRGRGGRGYQAMAVVLTYLSIVSSYIPMVITGLSEAAAKQHDSATAGDGAGDAAHAPDGAAAAAPAASQHATAGDVIMGVGVIVGLAIAAPFLAGASNFMGWLIIGIALWEAWKINRRVQPKILGPYRLGPGAQAPPAP